MRCERGYTKQLPDLAVWLKRSAPPVALIAESGGRREDRQKMILEGWRDAIMAGRYAAVVYDCASVSVTLWITRLAKKVRLTPPAFSAAIQPSGARDRRGRSGARAALPRDLRHGRTDAPPPMAPPTLNSSTRFEYETSNAGRRATP